MVCNLGEQAEIWSRGYFLATPHRVLANKQLKPRTSIAFFYNPRLDATITSIPKDKMKGKVRWKRPQNYEQTNNHWKNKNNTMLLSSMNVT